MRESEEASAERSRQLQEKESSVDAALASVQKVHEAPSAGLSAAQEKEAEWSRKLENVQKMSRSAQLKEAETIKTMATANRLHKGRADTSTTQTRKEENGKRSNAPTQRQKTSTKNFFQLLLVKKD